MHLRSLLREPLVHFLLIGAALFLFFAVRGGSGPDSNRIVIGPGQVQHLAMTFSRTWRRPPSDAELKGLVDDYVREEMAAREARLMGLDRGDTVIRRRLRQKLEFLVEDSVAAADASEEELQAWLDEHPESYRLEPQIAFRQVYLSPERRGERALDEARALLDELRVAGAEAELERYGDPIMLPEEVALSRLSSTSRLFGNEFAARLDALPAGEWSGPVESGYGLHLVYVSERVESRAPTLDMVRDAVARDRLSHERESKLETMYDELLDKYDVVIEMPEPEAPGETP